MGPGENSIDDARSDPLVAAVLARFPGAEIVDVRVTGAEPPVAPSAAEIPAMTDEPPFDEED